MSNDFDFEPLDLNEIQQESQRVNSEETSGENKEYLQKFVQLPDRDGFVHLRFLPRLKGKKLYCATKIHYLNDGTGKQKVYHSPKNLEFDDRGRSRWMGESVIDKYLRDLWAKSETAPEKEQADMRSLYRKTKGVERYYYWVIVRQEKDSKTGEVRHNVGPKIFSCGKKVHAMIMRAISGDSKLGIKPLGDITHPVNGRDFKLIKKMTKSGDGGEYASYDLSAFETETTPLGSPEEIKNWLGNIHDLEELRVIKSEDELRQALKVHLGLVKNESTGFDASEFQAGGSQSNVSVAQKVVEPVRQNLVVQSNNTETSSDDEETLSDDDFMKMLETTPN